jgi:hypothetical protein
MLALEPLVIESVDPLEGHEGTVVTLRGSGFPEHIRNSCVVVGGMAACARVEPDSTATELKVRIGPVARVGAGDVLAWPGIGTDVHTERESIGDTTVQFSEVTIFRNGAPVTAAGVNFSLTEVSPNTYGGAFEKSAASRVQLGGYEKRPVMCVRFPSDLTIPEHPKVDICMVLKEPTFTLDLSADVSGYGDVEEALNAIAHSITDNAGILGEEVYTDVARNSDTGELELYVTKHQLLSGMLVIHFDSA